jgi:hypothetical protein
MTTVNSYGEATALKRSSNTVFTLLHRAWPLTAVGIALMANAIWIGLLGYALVKCFRG